MLNGEKFKKEIEDVDFDLAKCKGKIVNCCTTNCKACDFYNKERDCNVIIVKWLLEEYKEPLLSNEAINYLMTLILPYGLNELGTIIKINLCDELKYKLCVHLKDCTFTLYFQRGTELCQWFDNLENGKYYNAKDLGLC